MLNLLKSDEKAAALVTMDNFKGQIMPKVQGILEDNLIHSCMLPPNTTDLFQPIDLSVNKPAKEFLRLKFQEWYTDQVMEQIEGEEDIDVAEIIPVSLSMPVLKEIGAKWMVKMAEHISDNPQFITNGF